MAAAVGLLVLASGCASDGAPPPFETPRVTATPLAGTREYSAQPFSAADWVQARWLEGGTRLWILTVQSPYCRSVPVELTFDGVATYDVTFQQETDIWDRPGMACPAVGQSMVFDLPVDAQASGARQTGADASLRVHGLSTGPADPADPNGPRDTIPILPEIVVPPGAEVDPMAVTVAPVRPEDIGSRVKMFEWSDGGATLGFVHWGAEGCRSSVRGLYRGDDGATHVVMQLLDVAPDSPACRQEAVPTYVTIETARNGYPFSSGDVVVHDAQFGDYGSAPRA